MLARVFRKAVLYRMDTPEHVCPFGLRARWLLQHRGYDVEDHRLTSRAETHAFKAQHNVKTTPQVFIDGVRIGGYDDLRRHFGESASASGKSYWPVAAVFGTAALMALAAAETVTGAAFTTLTAIWFLGFSASLLAVLKLRDLDAFVNGFLGYDLLAQRWLPYAYLYPFAELAVGLCMIARALPYLAAPVALVIGGIGAVSVFKAVYLEKRDLKCACVGGGANVPLGAISLTENLMMIGMAVWMLLAPMAR